MTLLCAGVPLRAVGFGLAGVRIWNALFVLERPAGLALRHDAESAVGIETPAEADSGLIARCQTGDADAFARLVDKYQSAAAGVLWHFTRDPLVLEELLQDTFVQVYLSLRRFRPDAPFYPWLRTLATRVGYRHWRRQRQSRDRQARLEEWLRTTPAGVEPAEGDTAEYVYRVLELLDPKDRLVLTLQYFEGASVKEIAERMGWTAALVKVRAFRARKRLKALLEEAEKSNDEQA